MGDLRSKRDQLERELRAVEIEERNRAWAETQLQPYSRDDKERLLRYLTAWRKEQPGHDADCGCGECD